ncbi:type IV secretory system conjugative DNA transfer family protein, partial [Propionibacterium sp.]|uniref:type IV secretory system conjugative DNA transfer family protein n=1 Tax=Propionibacterium sp. TaxID=1977903 RepID=UPI0039EC3777
MAQNNRRRDPGGLDGQTIFLLLIVGVVALVLVAVNVPLRLAQAWTGAPTGLPGDPFTLLCDVAAHKVAFTATAWWLLAGLAALLLLVAIAVGLLVHARRGRHSRVDQAATWMGQGRDIHALSRKAVGASAARLGVSAVPGLPIGVTVTGAHPLFSSWEDMRITIAGPRTGKTTAMVVPEILAAPGAVLVTSNKRDVVDATRDVRAGAGPVWVFDPQGIALEEATWWWNPLSYVTDEVRATRLAEHFAAGSRQVGARTDAYFDNAGQDLLGGLLLAAALDHRPITDVYVWLTRPTDDTPVEVLRAGGFALTADQVAGVIDAPEKQRGGVYGTAMQMASCLTNRQVAGWVTPQGSADPRPQLSPEAFVRADGGTLYSLSKAGRATAGPLVTALTVAVVEAAEELAARSPGGRLATPLVGVLDEAANVCRWRELPNLYSHYGSRGIVLDTVLQSWSQGVEVWGEGGMKKLWSAANVKIYGGGVSEASFLEDLSRMIGDHDRLASSTSYGRGPRTVSHQLQRERILDVADLAALPRGRAVVIGGGGPPPPGGAAPRGRGPPAGGGGGPRAPARPPGR